MADAPRSEQDEAEWIADLSTTGSAHDQAVARLHSLLLRAARREVGRRASTAFAGMGLAGPETDDLAHQVASDATLAVLAKLSTFRGESRFTTWVYRFAVLEVSAKLGRHYWRSHRDVALEDVSWERFPDRFGVAPEHHAEGRELVEAVRAAVQQTLSQRERDLFVAVVVQGLPLDAVVAREQTNRNAVYKAIFDARRKIRAHLVANGYLNVESRREESS